MVDRVVKQTAAKAGASAADMAARPFQCEWHEGCSKSFNRKSDLQRHYRIHTNERPYACDYKPCNKTFIQRSALTVHRRTHTGDKPHKCPFLGCGKCFSDSSSLARHRRIHTNDKPYICRNQRCKKAKTTMTKHIRKEHPAEPVQDDQDADYSDVEASDDEPLDDDTDEIKEEPPSHYQEPIDSKKIPLGRPTGNKYHVNLWALPGQTAQRPSPLQLRRSAVPRSEAPCQEIKLERSSSATPQRALTDPYPDGHMHPSDFSLSRADTIPGNLVISSTMPQSHTNGSLPQQYQLRNHDSNVGLWSPQHAIQDSPTSLTHSSPCSASTQPHQMFTSQPYQLQSVDVPSHEQLQFPNHHEGLVSNTIHQPLGDLTVHEIHLDQPPQQQYRDMASTPVHQNPYDGGIQQHVPQQDSYIAMSREVSQRHPYDEPTPQSAIHQYPDDLPLTPAPTQQFPHYTTSMAETPYQQSQYIPLDNFSASNQVFPPNGGLYQYNDTTSNWLKDHKLEENGFLLPTQRVQEYTSNGWS